jgi:hypothetical protein
MNRLTTQLQGLQVFAGLEPDGFSGRNVHFGTGSWVSSDSGLSRLYGENAKPAQLNAIVGFKCVFHAIEDRIDCLLGLGFADACSLNDLVYKIQLDHGQPPRFAISFNTNIFNTPEVI